MEPVGEPKNVDLTRAERIEAARQFREQFPEGDFGRKLTKEEEESILGFGPAGV